MTGAASRSKWLKKARMVLLGAWIFAALIFIVSIWNLSMARRRPITMDMAHAGDKPLPP